MSLLVQKKSLAAKLSTYIKIHNTKKSPGNGGGGYEMGARDLYLNQ